jgi:hypothetical protein
MSGDAMDLYAALETHAEKIEDDELAERVRELMDFVWYKHLTTEEKQELNNRHTE